MKCIAGIILSMFLSLTVTAQQQCRQFPVRKIDIIPNPSFEVGNGCPSNYLFPGSHTSIIGWTSLHPTVPAGYVSRCSDFIISDSSISVDHGLAQWFTEPRGLTLEITSPPVMPQPLPDGNATLLITDRARISNRQRDSDYVKTYMATCLLQPLQKDSLYRLDFSLGFGVQTTQNLVRNDRYYLTATGDTVWIRDSSYFAAKAKNGVSNQEETIAIYGKSDCTHFSSYQYNYRCLKNEGWTELGTVTIKGTPGTWTNTSIAFAAPENMQAFAIGPGCQKVTRTSDTAYFFQYYIDNLQMYTTNIQRPAVVQAAGNQCNKTATLQLNPAGLYKATDLQWYKNSVPIAGAYGDTLHVATAGQGWYQCRVQNDSICVLTDSFGVFWQYRPPIDFLGKGDTTVCFTDSILLKANAGFGAIYLWQDGSTQPTLKVTKPGNYHVTITNACGVTTLSKKIDFTTCTDSLLIPTAFTPNGDGKNDEFKPVYYYTIGNQYNIIIFNRFGQLLFTSNNISKGWDGTYKGILQPAGTYIYQVTYKRRNDKTYYTKGTVTLIK